MNLTKTGITAVSYGGAFIAASTVGFMVSKATKGTKIETIGRWAGIGTAIIGTIGIGYLMNKSLLKKMNQFDKEEKAFNCCV